MIDLNPSKYKNEYFKALAMLIKNRCSEDPFLKEKCDTLDLSIESIFKYVERQAKKKAENGCAVLSDSEVLDHAVHFILEDGNTKPLKYSDEIVPVKLIKDKPVQKPKTNKETSGQLCFDF